MEAYFPAPNLNQIASGIRLRPDFLKSQYGLDMNNAADRRNALPVRSLVQRFRPFHHNSPSFPSTVRLRFPPSIRASQPANS